MNDRKTLDDWAIRELIARTEYIIGQLENTNLERVKHIYHVAIKTLEAELSDQRRNDNTG